MLAARSPDLVWLVLGVVIVAAAGVGAWLWVSDSSNEAEPATAGPAATATVKRGTISATVTSSGTLELGKPFTVTSSGEGTITRLAEQGETVKRGDKLVRVNEQPVILLYGAVPMYRDLAPGDSGADVKQLETNLAKLGYGGFTVNNKYTPFTAKAVRAWQKDIGAERTGTVARGDAVFVPEGGQVDALIADVGDLVEPGAAVLDITGTDQVVNLEVDVDDRGRFEVGTEVTVGLPGGNEVPGTVSTTAVVAAAPDDAGEGVEGPAAASDAIAQVEITLDKQVSDDLVGAPVDVIAAIEERKDVLFVPVDALLAVAEGGFGLEVVADGGTTSIVPVDTGLFGDGRVQVKGDEISEGAVVGTAGRSGR